ncbi:HopJ type III effector protein [Winogradskyella eckloniae]|uniref:HopJ type III effector protein n=1 Tax=Winogradskyella eckloniae TaxID=1089306 RepID=UPI0015657785|nr:HopJ type III effector protein [Winogradskyella eckloniae]NRD18697.1 HopJ type III effector protein [Winogradskyella eckloniae]
MNLEDFKEKLKSNPRQVEFFETMMIIKEYYEFTPTAFTNGPIENIEDQNSGSCKLFAFAIDQNLSKEETLACFGKYYFEDVLENPSGIGHLNIRNFIKTGFDSLSFKDFPLKKK